MGEIWAKGITDIKIVPSSILGKSPAAVQRKSGIILINQDFVGKLSEEQWIFILFHEWAHIKLKSRDEEAVDAKAHEEYMKRNLSYKESVYALANVLNPNSKSHIRRANAQLFRAALHDRKTNLNRNLDFLF